MIGSTPKNPLPRIQEQSSPASLAFQDAVAIARAIESAGYLLVMSKTIGKPWENGGLIWFNGILWYLPSGYVKIAMENGHWNSDFFQ